MTASYTVKIVLKSGQKIEIDGFFKNLEDAQEMWKLTRKYLEEKGYIKISDKYVYYFNPETIAYVNIGLTQINQEKTNFDYGQL